MCRLVLPWLLIGTRSCLLVVGLLSIAEVLCPSPCLFGTILVTVFDGVGLAGFKRRANAFILAWSALSFLSPTVLSFFSFQGLVVCGWGLWTDSVLTLSRPCTADSKIIIIKLSRLIADTISCILCSLITLVDCGWEEDKQTQKTLPCCDLLEWLRRS